MSYFFEVPNRREIEHVELDDIRYFYEKYKHSLNASSPEAANKPLSQLITALETFFKQETK